MATAGIVVNGVPFMEHLNVVFIAEDQRPLKYVVKLLPLVGGQFKAVAVLRGVILCSDKKRLCDLILEK